MRKTYPLLALLLIVAMLLPTLAACNDAVDPCAKHVDNDGDFACDVCGDTVIPTDDQGGEEDETLTDEEKLAAWQENYDVITVSRALELCGEPGNLTTERYYIIATIGSVNHTSYGSMTVSDETGSIDVYNTTDSNGNPYSGLAEKPVKGDTVLIYCTLQNFNGTKEVKSAWLVDFIKGKIEIDQNDYTDMTVLEARSAEVGAKIKLDGVVARITFASGKVPNGFMLVDDTSSIYVYDSEAAAQVAIGNKITVIGEKTYWVLDSEKNNANKFGYKGSCQLSEAIIIENDKGNNQFDKSWISETTLKDILDTPVTENITSLVYKITAKVEKRVEPGYVNYYFHDLDGATSTYTYTMCDGADFGWLDEFDGKICTVYITALNAKSTATACYFRCLPIEVKDEGFTFDLSKSAEFSLKYFGLTQFDESYTGDPALDLINTAASSILGFSDVSISYSSSDESIISFTAADGKTVMHCNGTGTATVTVTCRHGDNTASGTVTITVKENAEYDSLTVSEAIASADGTAVIVRGIVGPSVANKSGFYLIDDSGAVTVQMDATELATLKIGYDVVLSATRKLSKDGGQIILDGAVVLANYYGENEYSLASFITDKTVADLVKIPDTPDATACVYVVSGVLTLVNNGYSDNYYFTDDKNEIMLYSGKASQYSWLNDYLGVRVTVEIALCDWNAKGLKACILAVYTEDGKLLNTLNFNTK